MTHSFPDFTTHMLDLLKNTGPSGPTGPTPIKPFISKEKSETSRATEVGPVDLDWSHHSAASGPAKDTEIQSLDEGGTTGTSGTSILQRVMSRASEGRTRRMACDICRANALRTAILGVFRSVARDDRRR